MQPLNKEQQLLLIFKTNIQSQYLVSYHDNTIILILPWHILKGHITVKQQPFSHAHKLPYISKLSCTNEYGLGAKEKCWWRGSNYVRRVVWGDERDRFSLWQSKSSGMTPMLKAALLKVSDYSSPKPTTDYRLHQRQAWQSYPGHSGGDCFPNSARFTTLEFKLLQ